MSPDGKLDTTPECSHGSWNYLPQNRKKKNQKEKDNSEKKKRRKKNYPLEFCWKVDELNSLNSVTVPGFRAEAAY